MSTLALEDKVAIVTGAGSGIGRASALLFAREGARVVVADLDPGHGNETSDAIHAAGGEAIFVQADVSSTNDAKAITAAAVEMYGRLDCAFNNAGIEGTPSLLHELSEAAFDRTIAVNLKGIWQCMRFEIPEMLKSGGGSIVNCSSVASLVGFRTSAAYCATKGGVNQLTRTAALEYADAGIRVNAVCPGIIHTPMIDRFTHGDASTEAALKSLEPVGRMGAAEEVAAAALWLCSDAASFVTGHPLVVDGGLVAQ